MKLSLSKVKQQCRRQGRSMGAVLRESGVSRNAFYTLSRKDSVVPRSLRALAAELDVPISALCDETPAPGQEVEQLLDAVAGVKQHHSSVDADNVRHTLLLLQEKPFDRLRRALRRGRPLNLR